MNVRKAIWSDIKAAFGQSCTYRGIGSVLYIVPSLDRNTSGARRAWSYNCVHCLVKSDLVRVYIVERSGKILKGSAVKIKLSDPDSLPKIHRAIADHLAVVLDGARRKILERLKVFDDSKERIGQSYVQSTQARTSQNTAEVGL